MSDWRLGSGTDDARLEERLAHNQGPDVLRTRDRLWVNEARTVLVRQWASGTVEVALRDSPDHTWGPPVNLTEER